MIDQVRGVFRGWTPSGLRLEVGPVVLHLRAANEAFAGLREGDEISVHTHLALRDDGVQLFAFPNPSDRELFLTMQGIQGLGSERALALLAALGGAEGVLRAVAAGDLSMLRQVKGIGERLGRRIVTELSARKELLSGVAPAPRHQPARDAETALVRLGFPPDRARRAVARALEKGGERSAEALVKDALAVLSAPDAGEEAS